jgi:predicted nucleic acid-binding protein
MKVLVDTDVLLDLALDRDPFAGPAGEVLDWLALHPGAGGIAWHSASNFYYLASGANGKRDAVAFLADLLEFMEVAPVATRELRAAIGLHLPDFEDAMQIAAAMAFGADRIVTRNIRHYRRSPVPALTPRRALAAMK